MFQRTRVVLGHFLQQMLMMLWLASLVLLILFGLLLYSVLPSLSSEGTKLVLVTAPTSAPQILHAVVHPWIW